MSIIVVSLNPCPRGGLILLRRPQGEGSFSLKSFVQRVSDGRQIYPNMPIIDVRFEVTPINTPAEAH